MRFGKKHSDSFHDEAGKQNCINNANEISYAFMSVSDGLRNHGGMEMLKHLYSIEKRATSSHVVNYASVLFAAHLLSCLKEWHPDKCGT